MKKLFTIFVLSAIALTAFAQQKKVAVYVTGEQTGISKVLGDQLVAAFAKSGKYIAIERTTSFLAELGKEQTYQRTGAVDDNELSRIGKQFGVQLVCVADISDVFGEKYISTRLIDVESAEVINTSNATSKLESMQELLKVTDKLAKELTAKTVYERAEEALQKQQEYASKEKELKPMLDNGYIKVGNLYATITYSRVLWKKTGQIAKDCRIGDMTGWRLPTVTELNMVYQGIRQYQSEKEFYPNIADQLSKIDIHNQFFTSDKTYGTPGFERKSITFNNEDYEDHFVILVHDAK